MKRSVGLWEFFGFAATSIGGTLLHFLYDKTNGALWAAPFSSVNESTFEHMKLLFWPMFIYAIVQSLLFKENEGFWCVKLRGILLGLFLIPFMFYGYNGIIGKSPDRINIAIFFISAAVAYVYEYHLFKKGKSCKAPRAAFFALLIIALIFIVFTFATPSLELFRDPLTATYGI